MIAKVLTFSILATALAYLAFSISNDVDSVEMKAEPPSEVALTVSEAVVVEAEWPVTINATGPISAWQEAVIGAEISGQRLVAVMVDVGDVVEKGQVLARFNAAMLTAEYAELKANWIAAESSHKRALTLKGTGAMSDQVIEAYVNQAAVAKARMEANAVELAFVDVVAPDDGVISARYATLGAVGGPGQALFRLIRKNRLEWRGELTAEQSVLVMPGRPVALTLPSGDKTHGTVRQVAPSFDPGTRMTTVYVDLEMGAGARAGMYAEGNIILDHQTGLSVPAKSVVFRDGRTYLFCIERLPTGDMVRRQEVQVGRTQDGAAHILSGVAAGDRIVLQGAGFLNDSDRVRVSTEKGGE